jgi:MFS family permease
MFEDPEQRAFAIGVWATSFVLGAAIGSLAGGFLLEFFWWGSVFLLAMPVMALLLVLGPVLLPEYRDPGAGRLDLISAAMSLVAVVLVIYGLKQIVQDGVVTRSHYLGGVRRKRPVRAQAVQAGRPSDRPPALSGTGVRHLAFRVPAQHLRDSRHLLLRRPVPPTRAPALAA